MTATGTEPPPDVAARREGGGPCRVVVIGGGLAGIAAAVRLAQGGAAVALIETRKRLGGRATSFVDPATGQVLDNCQHVLLGCCTNLLDLYDRLGVGADIQWHSRLHFIDAAGRLDTMAPDPLPAPLHMTRALMRFKSLTLADKLAIARGMLAIMRLGRAGRAKLYDVSFAQWLEDHRQPRGAVEKFWATIVISAVNERPDRMAAGHAIQVFQEGFLASRRAALMGLPNVPLVKLYDSAQRVLADAGGQVRLASSAEALVYDAERRRVSALRMAEGQSIAADAFVSALPFDRLAKLCAPAMLDADVRLQSLDRFEVSPIIGIHMWFQRADDRPVMDLPHLILTQSPLQWIFNKGRDADQKGQHLHGVISAAHDLVDKPADAIIDMAVRAVRQVLPGAAEATLTHARVVKEKRATFSAQPGVESLRPSTRGPIANLYLAGDWCRTGWPATMEGAVRSGYLAAAAVLSDAVLGPTASPSEAEARGEGDGRGAGDGDRDALDSALVPDLPAGPLYRLIAPRR